MKPLTIVVSFDVGEQVVPGGISGFIASLVHEFSFQSAEAAFHRCIVETISFPAHGLDHAGCVENFAVISGGVLAAAIRMVNEALRRFLPLDGHGQGRDSQFRPHVIAHCPAGGDSPLVILRQLRSYLRSYIVRHWRSASTR
jgi:hypothetical protein